MLQFDLKSKYDLSHRKGNFMPVLELAMNEIERIVFGKKENVTRVIYESFFNYYGIPPTPKQINCIFKEIKISDTSPSMIADLCKNSGLLLRNQV